MGSTILDNLDGTVVEDAGPTFELTQSAGRYFTVDDPDAKRVSQHTDLSYAIESAFQHARTNGINGKYAIARAAKWDLTTMGFKARSRNPGDVLPPTVPPGVVAALTAVDTITLTWGASTDVSGIKEYRVQKVGSSTVTTVLANAARSSVFTGLVAGSHAFNVSAVDVHDNVSLPRTSNTVVIVVGLQWNIPDVPFAVPGTWFSNTAAQTYNVAQHANDPQDIGIYSITSQLKNGVATTGWTINPNTGVVSVPATLAAPVSSLTPDNYSVSVSLAQPATELTSLTLTGGGTGKAWTFGQAFKKADVPTGSYITATGSTSFQAEVRNRWADGSVKFAVLSGVGGTSVALSATVGTAPTATEVALVDPQASVTFTGSTFDGTYACPTTNTTSAWNKAAAHLVRKIAGSVMTERHYYVPTTDAHVAVWFYVRSYAGGATEVEAVVENGWLNVATPTAKTYTVAVSVGGTERYPATALSHLHHTRWSRTDWVDSAYVPVTPSHNSAYLRSTKLVPNYTTAYGAPSAATLNALPQTLAPFAQGYWPSGMGNAGSGGKILNNWEALYVTSGDARAFNATICQSQSAGRYGIHYRDETTGLPPVMLSYSNYVYGSNAGISDTGSGLATFPANGGAAPPTYTRTHAVPLGYLPYLTTGRHSFCEQVEFQAQTGYFGANSTQTFESHRIMKTDAGAFTTRGVAWSIRATAAAVVCVPDSGSAQYRTYLGKVLGFYGTGYTNQNNLGAVVGYSSYNAGTTDYTNFMEDSLTMASAWAHQVATEHLGSEQARAEAFILWRMKHIVGRMGDQSGYCYRDAAVYTMRYANTDVSAQVPATFNAAMYADFATVYANTIGANTCSASNSLNGTSGGAPSILSTDPYPYWGLVHSALAFAVDLGAEGARTAWDRYVVAPNYAPSNFNNQPLWGVVPRT